MENATQISDVQYINLNLLLTIQSNLRHDPIATSFRYRLSADQADRLAKMSVGAIHTLVANMSNECLFAPRENFTQLLDAPPGLTLALSTVNYDARAPGAARDCGQAKAA